MTYRGTLIVVKDCNEALKFYIAVPALMGKIRLSNCWICWIFHMITEASTIT